MKQLDVEVTLKEIATGKEFTYKDYLPVFDDNTPCTFNWSEGNFSCDCNRDDFFNKENAGYQPDTSGFCSAEKSKYLVTIKNFVTKEVIYDENT